MKITLCGSLKFEDLYHQWNKVLTLAGHVVYSVSVFPSIEKEKNWYDDDQKTLLDLVHLEKIRNSDAVVILNKGGYVGESTMRELLYARMIGRQVFWHSKGDTELPKLTELLATHLIDVRNGLYGQ